MPWNGSGSFTLNQDFPADRDAGSPTNIIDADKVDDEFRNIKAGLEATLNRNGENAATANISMGGNKLVSVGNATNAQDAMNQQTADARYLLKSNNLSDLTNAATARTNLGLGTIATQAANSVNIDGGAIDGTPIGASSASTGAFTTLLAGTDKPVYHRGNVLGTVSQSGGDPTGAVIERDDNANGRYVRFADGTQICTQLIAYDTSDTPDGVKTYSYPAAFVGGQADHVSASLRTAPAGGNLGAIEELGREIKNTVSSSENGSWRFRPRNYTGGDIGIVSVTLYAIGRWF